MYLVEKWGRKRTLALFLILGGVSGYVFATASQLATVFVSLAFVSFFNLGAWGAVYPYPSELFPTQYRATGFGLAEGVGKITAIMGPVIFGALYASTGGIIAPLTAIAVVMALGGVVLAGVGAATKRKFFSLRGPASWKTYNTVLSFSGVGPRISCLLPSSHTIESE